MPPPPLPSEQHPVLRTIMADIKFPLLRLPLELREHIYSYYFRPGDRLKVHEVPSGGQYRFEFALFRVNKQIYAEARTLWRRKYAFFVRLNLPWDNAGTLRDCYYVCRAAFAR